MKIVFCHQNFPGQFRHLAPALAARGHEVIGLAVNRPAFATPGVRVIRHRPVMECDEALRAAPVEIREAQAKIARGHSVACSLTRLREEGFLPELIVAHSGWGEAYFIKDVFPDVPLIVYAEYYYQAEGGDAFFDREFTVATLAARERLRLKNTHLLHALLVAERGLSPTAFQRSRHPEVLQQRISVIHDGIATAALKPDPAASVRLTTAGLTLVPSDEVVTFVARQLEPYRGYHIFMRALPELLSLRPKAHVVIVGGEGVSYGAAPPAGTTWKSVFLDEVGERIDRRRVHFVGTVPHDVLRQLFQVSTVHAYLSYPFVLSWSLLEAMSIGCLIVGSRTAPVEEVIEHGRTGLLVDFFDAHRLALTVADALARRAELSPLRRAARDHAVAHYDLSTRCLPAQVDLIDSVARGSAC